jgi:hypothetical protein
MSETQSILRRRVCLVDNHTICLTRAKEYSTVVGARGPGKAEGGAAVEAYGGQIQHQKRVRGKELHGRSSEGHCMLAPWRNFHVQISNYLSPMHLRLYVPLMMDYVFSSRHPTSKSNL